MHIHVDNVSDKTAEVDLRRLFEKFGEVSKTAILSGKFSGNEKGIGFIEMPVRGEGEAAIHGLNGCKLDGHNLIVSEARQRDHSGAGGANGSRHRRRSDSR